MHLPLNHHPEGEVADMCWRSHFITCSVPTLSPVPCHYLLPLWPAIPPCPPNRRHHPSGCLALRPCPTPPSAPHIAVGPPQLACASLVRTAASCCSAAAATPWARWAASAACCASSRMRATSASLARRRLRSSSVCCSFSLSAAFSACSAPAPSAQLRHVQLATRRQGMRGASWCSRAARHR